MQSEIYWLRKRIFQLESENEKLRKLAGERAALAAQLAATHDRMTLDLILCGALATPKKETPMLQHAEVPAPSTSDSTLDEQIALREIVAGFRAIADYVEANALTLDNRHLQNAFEQMTLSVRETLDEGRARRFAAGNSTSEFAAVVETIKRAIADGKFLTVTPRNFDIESEAMRLMQERGWPETTRVVASTKVRHVSSITKGSGVLLDFYVDLTLAHAEG